jgi:predicted lipoprotein with Yx(FWY)xxD motif
MRRAVRMVFMMCAGAAGVGLALLVGIAVAKSFTLQVDKSAKVTNANTQKSTMEAIGTYKGFAVYMLSGDSKSHPECTKAKGCFGVWPPVKLSSARKLSKAPGIKGKLSVWRRDGFIQLVLGGHPLYRFSGDGSSKGIATGQDITSFGGTWHVVTAAGSSGSGAATGSTGMTTTGTTSSTPTMTTPTYPYP